MDKLSLLLLEDEVMDANLIIRMLERSDLSLNFEAIIVSDKEEFLYIIQHKKFDAILADNSLPQFNAKKALQLTREMNIKIPFILVTGAVSEEYAVEIMKAGASDYILKDRLQRLPNAIVSAIDKYHLETEREEHLGSIIKSEMLMKEAEQLAHFGSWESDLIEKTDYWSDEMYRILGYGPGEVAPSVNNFIDRVQQEDLLYVTEIFEDTIKDLPQKKFECKIATKDGVEKYIYSELIVTRDEHGTATRINGFINDVTESKEVQLRLLESEKKYRELFKKSPVPLWVIDSDTYRFLDVNEAAVKHYGYSREEFLSMTNADIMDAEEKERFLNTHVISTGDFSSMGVWRHIKKDGVTIKVEMNMNRVIFEGKKAQLFLANDVN